MSFDEEKHVWILGAGFSRALGGPLINDLLAERPLTVLQALLPPGAAATGMEHESGAVREFCKWGRDAGYWKHAEEFIDELETAMHDGRNQLIGAKSASYLRIQAMIDVRSVYPISRYVRDLPMLFNAARRAIVADCWCFLQGAAEKLANRKTIPERWRTYLAWAKKLNGNHTIITFNYDVVPELLIIAGAALEVVKPADAIGQGNDLRERGVAPVLKLHGSTTWCRERGSNGEVLISSATEPPTPLTDQKCDPVLGFPGPTKVGECEEVFSDLWEEALTALDGAEHIHFLGYRFPETDLYALNTIVGKIMDREFVPNIHIALGPPSFDTARMQTMFIHHRGALDPKVNVENLYCADYLVRYTF